jgi:hypothetical protein
MDVRRNFRKDVFAAGATLIAVGLLVFFTPLTVTSVLTASGFSYSGKAGWYESGLVYLPKGDALSVKLISDVPVSVGFASFSDWNAFLNSSATRPVLLAGMNGASGTVSLVARANTLMYIVIAPDAGTALPVLELVVNATNPHGFADYAYIALVSGFILVALSMSYESAKKALNGRFRHNRL